jgi:hypothetical protein
MEATEAPSNGRKTIKATSDTETIKPVRTPRRARPAPLVFKSDQLKDPRINLPPISSQGVSIELLKIRKHKFALTPDGESVNIKLNKTESLCIFGGSDELFDHKGLTVYPYAG